MLNRVIDESESSEDWFDVAAASAPDTPLLVVSEIRILNNVQRAAWHARHMGKMLCPHVKTHKMLEVARMQLAAGATGLQVAKLSEADVMLESGVRDLLLAYPVVGKTKWDRVRDLSGQVDLRISLDSVEVATGISESLSLDSEVGILLEVDTGLHRVGVAAGDVGELALAVGRLPGLRVIGVMTHEGHIGRRAQKDPRLTVELTAAAVNEMRIARDVLGDVGVVDPMISMGSTSTFEHLLTYHDVDEVRPGLYVFFDMNSVTAGAGRLDDVAAVVVSTVVSRSPQRGEFVIDAGSKSLSSDRRDLPNGSITFGFVPSVGGQVVRLSEEHGVVSGAHRIPNVGERVVVVPNHICPVINLFDDAVLVDEDGVSGSWSIAARGRVR
ncbi:alanine racemase [Rhodococcus sp. NPDC060176]|uniref:alanine racemase n=1 Tax=Rhodococcus sp. NPDC060176 TaxID=3347062 RepID=UPI003661D88B